MSTPQTAEQFNGPLTGSFIATVTSPQTMASGYMFDLNCRAQIEREKKLQKLLSEPILTQPDFTPLRSTLILTKWEIQELMNRLKEFIQ
jgi:hypothetical protein